MSEISDFFEALPDAIVIVNQEGQMAKVNARTENLFGYAREELQGQPIGMLIPERFRGQIRCLSQRMYPEIRWEQELVFTLAAKMALNSW